LLAETLDDGGFNKCATLKLLGIPPAAAEENRTSKILNQV
jgi:hypothetical protein